MRCVMMGTGGFAVPTYEALLVSGHEVVATVTRPPRRGRGQRPSQNPIQAAAERHAFATYAPGSINAEQPVAWLKNCQADVLVVCDYGEILAAATLGATRLGGINLHGSLLPEYRGAAPVQWALYDGKSETGVSVIHMTSRLDGGPVLVQQRTPIAPHESAVELEQRLAEIGAEAVLAALDVLKNWDGIQAIGVSQSDRRATRAPRLKKDDGRIDWTRTAQQIADQIRAFKPWPGTFTFFARGSGKAKRLIVDDARVVAPADPRIDDRLAAAAGTVLVVGASLLVSTGHGFLQLLSVQPEGKKHMSGEEFLRGHPACAHGQLG
jgi:methionyl-tRNA formyltransferase